MLRPMEVLRCAALTITVAWLLVEGAGAQTGRWTRTGGIEGGMVRALVRHESYIFAGTGGGVFRSADGGASWQGVNQGLSVLSVTALATSGNRLFVGTNGGGVLVSTDRGQSWRVTGTTGILGPAVVNSLAVVGEQLFAATPGSGVFRLRDDGQGWAGVNRGLKSLVVLALSAVGPELFAGTTGGVFQTSDDGQNWKERNAGLPQYPLTFSLAAGGSKLFAGTVNGVYVSTDGGEKWAPSDMGINFPPPVFALAVDGADIWASTEPGVFRSANGGQSWEASGAGLGGRAFSLLVADERVLAGTEGAGVFTTTREGRDWVPANTGLAAGSVSTLAVKGATIFAGTDGTGVFRSVDEGGTWAAANEGLADKRVTAFAVSGEKLFAGTVTGGIFRSADDGRTWVAVNQGLVPGAITSLAVTTGGKVFAGHPRGLFVLTDEAQGWKRIDAVGRNDVVGMGVTAVVADREHVYASTPGAVGLFLPPQIYVSDDGGEKWTWIHGMGPLGEALISVSQLLAWEGTLFVAGEGGVHGLEMDGPDPTWMVLNNGLVRRQVHSLAASGAMLFAGTDGGGAHASINGGRNWAPISDGLSNPEVRALAFKGTRLLAGTSGGVFALDDPSALVSRTAVNVSAASYVGTFLAPESLAAVFGDGLAAGSAAAATLPLPTSLAGTTVTVTDSGGMERPAPLLYVSPGQVNYLVPAGTSPGPAVVKVTSGPGKILTGEVVIAELVPGLFTANGDGKGVAAALVLRVWADGTSVYEPVAQFDAGQKKYIPLPIDLGPGGEQVFLILYGTGMRAAPGPEAVTSFISGELATATFIGPAPGYAGLEQLNLRIPRGLAGRGEVPVRVTINYRTAEPVTISIR